MATATQKATLGRIVRYVHGNGVVRPAIVVHVWGEDDSYNGTVQLQVFNDADAEGKYNDGIPAVQWKTSVEYNENKQPNTWHWPEIE